VVTQNVDGLHQRAGSRDVVELHGSLVRSVCARGCGPAEPGEGGGTRPPPCPRCGAHLRPDVVWFGENLPAAALERAMDVVPAADLVVSVGTANQVQPAASLPFLALRNARPVLEVNVDATPLTEAATWHFGATAAEALPALAAIAMNEG
jgi:NAD-dependent deacetylase